LTEETRDFSVDFGSSIFLLLCSALKSKKRVYLFVPAFSPKSFLCAFDILFIQFILSVSIRDPVSICDYGKHALLPAFTPGENLRWHILFRSYTVNIENTTAFPKNHVQSKLTVHPLLFKIEQASTSLVFKYCTCGMFSTAHSFNHELA
jgi:hypothetical protein